MSTSSLAGRSSSNPDGLRSRKSSAWPPLRRVQWKETYRIIPSRYPPIALFERVADPADWDALADIESLTNERVRDEVGEIQRVPLSERVTGPGASWVMAAFTHIGYPSRFSDGTYGVYYTAKTRECAIAETVYHWSRFYRSTSEAPLDVDMRVLLAGIDATLHDIRIVPPRERSLYDPNDYRASQAFAKQLSNKASNGLIYHSVRRSGDLCVAAFRPRVMSKLPHGDTFLLYHFNGRIIDRYFDYSKERWTTLLPNKHASAPYTISRKSFSGSSRNPRKS